ncbi:MAG: hypothetical protein HN472_01665 [Nitrospina sp.]|nr:hypothetical protein [Nitrospina sp.]MBT4048855.1 hypothetical protein [Nitrospina sp.]MBT4556574.1 hypothetical protein [Nitrospina sp.]MBT5633793.1 hypothetical protein [Nitrospina sp.]MBT7196805.1 hypothetical protein [Nitrospina sp.]
MNWKFFIKKHSKSRDMNMPAIPLVLLLAFILPSCANMKEYVPDMKMPDIELQDFVVEETSDKKARLSELALPLKETNFIFSPIISLKDLNEEGVQKNKFFLAGEIYSKNPEEPIDSLSSDDCFSPRDQGSISKLERLYHVFIKDLGLNSVNVNELGANDKIGPHFLIQPVLLKYQYCKRAYVEIRYLIQTDTGTQTARTIKTSHRAEYFKFPEKEEHHPFFNYNHPGAQFPGLKHALTMAFYKNTMDLIEVISDEQKENETK